MRDTSMKPRIMIQSTFDLIRGWQAECDLLEQKIAGLRTGISGWSLTPSQKEAAIRHLIDSAAEFQSLIAEFSQHEDIPITFGPAQPDAPEAVIRRRFSTSRQTAAASAGA